jgi:hypothetical protein
MSGLKLERKSKQVPYTLRAGAPPTSTAGAQIYTAACIAQHYASRLPTVAELQRDYEMSRPTAYRWRAAFKYARGMA